MLNSRDEIKRTDLHAAFGGQRMQGMSTPSESPYIFLFTGSNGHAYGYEDHFVADGEYWYTGEGQVGDMVFDRANLALRDHLVSGKRVFLFDQTRKAHIRQIGEFAYLGYHYEDRPDRNGDLRKAIIFHLELRGFGLADVVEEEPAPPAEADDDEESDMPTKDESLSSLRTKAVRTASKNAPVKQRLANLRKRSRAIKLYALKRAKGTCECCKKDAPFKTRSGPFLEVHHLDRIADGGPDHPEHVAGICPNCHREIHFGVDGKARNESLAAHIAEKERKLAGAP